MKILRFSLLLLLCLGGAMNVYAGDSQNPPPPPANMQGDGQMPPPHGGHHHPGPPPEALAACKGQAVGAKASLKTPRGDTLSGSCQLVFVPDAKPGDKGGDMPPPPRDGQQHGQGGGGW